MIEISGAFDREKASTSCKDGNADVWSTV